MKESISKVRSSVAYAVSAIAHWDWPEAWPDLFPILMQALTSGDANAVHGAMRVLAGMAVKFKKIKVVICLHMTIADGRILNQSTKKETLAVLKI